MSLFDRIVHESARDWLGVPRRALGVLNKRRPEDSAAIALIRTRERHGLDHSKTNKAARKLADVIGRTPKPSKAAVRVFNTHVSIEVRSASKQLVPGARVRMVASVSLFNRAILAESADLSPELFWVLVKISEDVETVPALARALPLNASQVRARCKKLLKLDLIDTFSMDRKTFYVTTTKGVAYLKKHTEELPANLGKRKYPRLEAGWGRPGATLDEVSTSADKIKPAWPDTAEDGKAFVVLWADGRGICAWKHKKDMRAWISHEKRDVCWIRYESPQRKGQRLRVSTSWKAPKTEDFPNRMWWDMPHNPAEPHQKSPAKTAKNKQVEIQPDGNVKPMDNPLPGNLDTRITGRAGGSRVGGKRKKTGPSLGGKYQRNV